ncbi:MAG: DNA gyrase subunit A, partial [Chloroflexi bacterium]|nr:DNA gyrase subunit A [Chloroflexota bacterium]
FLDYAMSVIVQRALPDVRDGLKPVQRRILYAMNELGMRPGSAYKKSARLVGEVLGKYHPHGDTSVYDAMVRLAQNFSMRYPLVDGQGNFGSVDGDPPAAMRYTEARLASIADTLLSDIDRDTVDWSDNFDASLKEPVILPARLPNLLVNGSAGIAVGMATNIPPHNLGEICDGIVHLIDTPDADVDDLMRYVKGPDFPTGAHIWGAEGIKNAFATGRGRVIVQASHEIEEIKKSDRLRLLITEIPFQVNKAQLVAKIADLAKTKKIEGISEVRDESDRKGMRIVIELRRGASANVVLNNLYKHTPLRSAFSVNMLALVDGMPQVLNLKQALRQFIDFRREVITRRAQFDLRKARARLHVVEGLRIAVENIDRVIALIRGSADVDEARANLMSEFSLSEIQAQAILDMQLRRLAALEREKIEEEYRALVAEIADLEALLASPTRILGVVRREMLELKRKFGDDRRTVIHQEEIGEWRREDTEPHEEVVITYSKAGYVKRIATNTYNRQHRGGKGVKGQRMTKEDDVLQFLQVADTHDHLLFFTNRGRVFTVRGFELPSDATRTSRGTLVNNVINLDAGERVSALLSVESLVEDTYIVLCTAAGAVKRMHLSRLANLRRNGLNVMKLKNGDSVESVVLALADQDVILVTDQGSSIRFPSTQIRARGRIAGGVRGIRLQEKDRVVAMDVCVEGGRLLIATRRGFGKMSTLQSYRLQNRGGKGILTFRLTPKNGKIVAAQVVKDEDEVMLATEQALLIKMPLDELRTMGRITQGVTLQKLETGDAVSAIVAKSSRRTPVATIDPNAVPDEENGEEAEEDEALDEGAADDEMDEIFEDEEEAPIGDEDE